MLPFESGFFHLAKCSQEFTLLLINFLTTVLNLGLKITNNANKLQTPESWNIKVTNDLALICHTSK